MREISEEREPLIGFWMGLAGVILMFTIPFLGFLVALIGLSFSARAYQRGPVNATHRRLAIAGIVLGGGAIAVGIIQSIAGFLFSV